MCHCYNLIRNQLNIYTILLLSVLILYKFSISSGLKTQDTSCRPVPRGESAVTDVSVKWMQSSDRVPRKYIARETTEMASLHKNRRTTLERIEKFTSRIYFSDVNLCSRIYPLQESIGNSGKAMESLVSFCY